MVKFRSKLLFFRSKRNLHIIIRSFDKQNVLLGNLKTLIKLAFIFYFLVDGTNTYRKVRLMKITQFLSITI